MYNCGFQSNIFDFEQCARVFEKPKSITNANKQIFTTFGAIERYFSTYTCRQFRNYMITFRQMRQERVGPFVRGFFETKKRVLADRGMFANSIYTDNATNDEPHESHRLLQNSKMYKSRGVRVFFFSSKLEFTGVMVFSPRLLITNR